MDGRDFPALQRHSGQRPDHVGRGERDDADATLSNSVTMLAAGVDNILFTEVFDCATVTDFNAEWTSFSDSGEITMAMTGGETGNGYLSVGNNGYGVIGTSDGALLRAPSPLYSECWADPSRSGHPAQLRHPLCVNPAHLSPGTYQQNMADRMAKRQGLTLVKSRHRDPRVLDYQGYMLCRGDTSRMETNDAIDDRQFLATG